MNAPAASSSTPRVVLAAQSLMGACLIAAIIARAPHDRWNVPQLLVLGAIALSSDMLAVRSESQLKISGNSIAVVLAAVLLGGAPAAIVGGSAILVGWLRWREEGHYLRNNLLAFTLFPFVVGTGFWTAAGLLGASPNDPEFYALVVPAYLCAVALNFWLVMGYQCLLDRRPLRVEAGRMFQLLITFELACAVLTASVAWLSMTVGIVGLTLVAVALVAYQHLLGQLLVSRERGEQLRRLAVTDALTGLANRTGFVDCTELALIDAQTAGARVGVMLMDLDGFKEVNDSLGHHVGDLLLTGVGHRIKEVLGPGDREVARVGGDEFALVVFDDPDEAQLVGIARELSVALARPVELQDLSLEVSASIGIAQFPGDGGDVQTLLQRADLAMYAAKDDGTHIEVYAPQRNRHTVRRVGLTADLRAGIGSGQVCLHFQPQVDIATQALVGVEALARWQHPTVGQVPASEFIELAEHTGLIRLLTEHVLDLGLEQLRDWCTAGFEPRLAINLSARLLANRALGDQLVSQLTNAGITPDRLALEITETTVLRDRARALSTLTQLSRLGIGLSIDDFGTGYSSLAYLRELPLDEIKVDRSFVSAMTRDASAAVIVRSTVALGRSLDLVTVAEGVEDAETFARLRGMSCAVAQGYLFGKPLPGDETLRWARARAKTTQMLPGPSASSRSASLARVLP